MEDVDLPLKVGRTRIGSDDAAADDDDESTIFSDLANLRNRTSNSSSVSISTRSATVTTADNTVELDAGSPVVAEVEGDKPIAELGGIGKEIGSVAELDASQTFVELPGDFEKNLKMDFAAGTDRPMGDVKTKFDFGV